MLSLLVPALSLRTGSSTAEGNCKSTFLHADIMRFAAVDDFSICALAPLTGRRLTVPSLYPLPCFWALGRTTRACRSTTWWRAAPSTWCCSCVAANRPVSCVSREESHRKKAPRIRTPKYLAVGRAEDRSGRGGAQGMA